MSRYVCENAYMSLCDSVSACVCACMCALLYKHKLSTIPIVYCLNYSMSAQ